MKILIMLLRIEWLKATRRRIFWVATGAFGLFTAIPAVMGIRNAHVDPNAVFALPDFLGTASGLGSLFTGVLMILLFAPEFSWRTARQNIIDGLSKEQFFAGKVMLLAGLVLLFMAVIVLTGISSTMLIPTDSGSGIFRSSDLSYMGGTALGMLVFGSFGLMLSTHLRSSGSALGTLFLYFIVEEIVAMLMLRTGSETFLGATDFLPVNLIDNLRDDLVHYPEVLAEINSARAELELVPLEFPDVGVLAIVALTYSMVLLGLSLLSMRKRDL